MLNQQQEQVINVENNLPITQTEMQAILTYGYLFSKVDRYLWIENPSFTALTSYLREQYKNNPEFNFDRFFFNNYGISRKMPEGVTLEQLGPDHPANATVYLNGPCPIHDIRAVYSEFFEFVVGFALNNHFPGLAPYPGNNVLVAGPQNEGRSLGIARITDCVKFMDALCLLHKSNPNSFVNTVQGGSLATYFFSYNGKRIDPYYEEYKKYRNMYNMVRDWPILKEISNYIIKEEFYPFSILANMVYSDLTEMKHSVVGEAGLDIFRPFDEVKLKIKEKCALLGFHPQLTQQLDKNLENIGLYAQAKSDAYYVKRWDCINNRRVLRSHYEVDLYLENQEYNAAVQDRLKAYLAEHPGIDGTKLYNWSSGDDWINFDKKQLLEGYVEPQVVPHLAAAEKSIWQRMYDAVMRVIDWIRDLVVGACQSVARLFSRQQGSSIIAGSQEEESVSGADQQGRGPQ